MMAKHNKTLAKPIRIQMLERKKNRTREEDFALFVWTETRNIRNVIVGTMRQVGLSEPMLTELLHTLREKTTVKLPLDTQCKKGCSYCCHMRVTASIPEVIDLYNAASRCDGVLDKVRNEYSGINTMDSRSWIKNQTPCPFLSDDACLVHDFRPGACRAYLSNDAADCKKAYESKDPDYSRVIVTLHGSVSHILTRAMIEACQDLGLPSYEVEVVAAVKVLLSDDKAIDKWLNKEDVFTVARTDD